MLSVNLFKLGMVTSVELLLHFMHIGRSFKIGGTLIAKIKYNLIDNWMNIKISMRILIIWEHKHNIFVFPKKKKIFFPFRIVPIRYDTYASSFSNLLRHFWNASFDKMFRSFADFDKYIGKMFFIGFFIFRNRKNL